MKVIDVNCLLGNWPFRKIRKDKLSDLLEVQGKNHIEYGFISSLSGVFYNDPFEADEDLNEIIKDTGQKHILTVNPLLVGIEDDLLKAKEKYDIKGVRIYPGYHNYSLGDDSVKELCRLLKENNLPLFISLRMEDERFNYLYEPRGIPVEEIRDFLVENDDLLVCLLTVRLAEAIALKELINSRNNIYFDTSGLKEALFVIEKLLEEIDGKRIMYGSNHPLFALKSTLLLVEKAEISDIIKEDILYNNAVRFLK